MRRLAWAGLAAALLVGAWLGLGEAPGAGREPGAEGTARRIEGAVSHVRDGDTIEVGGVAVRIANLDCAERDGAAGRRARDRMVELARGRAVACRLEGRRSYDREVGTCALAASGEDLGETLIAEGTCGRWRGRAG